MSVRIIVDSTADINKTIKDKLLVVPLTVTFGNEEFIDGVTIDHRKFYEMLIESDVMPTTSQPTPDAFEKVYKEVVDAGDTAVVLTISSKLSGTYQSAVIASEGYEDKIFIVDSQTATIALGILAEYALDLAQSGKTAQEIVQCITKERENVHILAMLDTLEYLKKGGRISKTAAFAGGLLSIKPVISIKDGEIVIVGKARGSKQGNNLLASEIKDAGGADFSKPIMLGYAGIGDGLLQKYIEDSAALWADNTSDLPYTRLGSVIGTHTGPGTIAVAFFKKTQ